MVTTKANRSAKQYKQKASYLDWARFFRKVNKLKRKNKPNSENGLDV